MRRLALTRVSETFRKERTEDPGRVALDLAGLLPRGGRYDTYSIRVMDMPYGASLSAGRNNGDQSWSLRPDQLLGLDYRPPAPDFTEHRLTLRVIGINGDDEAEVVGRFELAVTAAGHAPTIAATGPAEHVIPRLDFGELMARRSRRIGAATMTDWNLLGLSLSPHGRASGGTEVGDLIRRAISAETRRTTLLQILRDCQARLAELETVDRETANVVPLRASAAAQ